MPTGLPTLGRGRHDHPGAGACLMEYVSVLAGRRFGDRPRCTHRALAELARHVNDAVSAEARSRLVVLAPALIGTARHDPAVRAAVVAVCAAAGLDVDPDDRVLTGAAAASSRRLLDLTRARVHAAQLSNRALHTGELPWRRLLAAVGGLARARLPGSCRPGALRRVLARLDVLFADLGPAERDARLIALLGDVLDDELTATGRRDLRTCPIRVRP